MGSQEEEVLHYSSPSHHQSIDTRCYHQSYMPSCVPVLRRELRGPAISKYADPCSMGAALFGYDLGVIAYVIEAPDFLATVDLDPEEPNDANYMGFIVSSLLLG
jgi:hypothetical protein